MNAVTAVIDILRTELELEPEQVLLYNQKWTIPSDYKVMVVVGLVSSVNYGSKCETYKDGENFYENKSLNKLELISIDILSRGLEAYNRRDEIILALKSTYAEQVMEANSIKISSLPVGFNDSSELEGNSILYRYNVTINVYSNTSMQKEN